MNASDLTLLIFFTSLWVSCFAVGDEAPWAHHGGRGWTAPVPVPAQSSDADDGKYDTSAARVLTSFSGTFQHFLTQLSNSSSEDNTRVSAYDSQCLEDFRMLFKTPGDNPFHATKGWQVVDALGKPGSNVLGGNYYMYGSFDECLEIDKELQYCVTPLNITLRYIPSITIAGPLQMGICVPRSCNITDLEYYVYKANDYLHLKEPFFNITAEYNNVKCTKSKTIPYTPGAIAMIVVCAIFLALSFMGTSVDLVVKGVNNLLSKPEFSSMNPDPEKNSENSPLLGRVRYDETLENGRDIFSSLQRPLEFIIAFSLFKNVPMILSTRQPPTAITSLNGIRVLSMFWVILCHTHVWILLEGVMKNTIYVFTTVTHRLSYQAILNGYFAVDSFFFLSGTLVAYLTLREMEKKKGRFPFLTYYLHRYLRLTMVYAFLLFFWWTLTMYFGSGNMWLYSVGEKSAGYHYCNKYWWTNLLYINNFYPWKLGEECMGWTWYLANDMQFYVIAPLILIPLYYFFPIGLAVSGVLLAGSFIATGAIAGVNEYSANTFLQTPNGTVTAQQSDDIYIKPYCRIAPYLVGLVLGYILYKKIRINIHWFVDWMIYRGVWLLAAGCCISTVYGLYDSWHGHQLSLAENVSYYMFSRFVWAVGLALMVFACHNGYGWVINDFLSMKFWIPLGRLTYTAYLIHPIVLTVIFASARDTITFTDYALAVYAVAMVVISFGAAGVVAVFVEFPLSNLEMAVFKAVGLKLRESTRHGSIVVKEDTTIEPLPPPGPPDGSVKTIQ